MSDQTIGVITPVRAKEDQDVAWLIQAIKSVLSQPVDDWQMVIANDQSAVNFQDYHELKQLFKDKRITGKRNLDPGVSNARNLAAATVDAPLLLPLDHDDWFPENAFTDFLEGWNSGGSEKGIVHGDILLYQNNSQRIHAGHPYNFQLLLQQLYMPIGCLFRKSDWARAGGWKPEMNAGLEDWEFWLTLGTLGVCGHYVPKTLYVYRRHAQGRLAHLRTQPEAFEKAQAQMRDLHRDIFAGRFPVGCCHSAASAAPQGGAAPAQNVREQMAGVDTSDLVRVLYVGGMNSEFFIEGRPSGIRYTVPGKNALVRCPDGRAGVDPRDLRWILGQDRGNSFRRE